MVKIFDEIFFFSICLPEDCTKEERYAADTLKKYLDMMTGREIAVECESADVSFNGPAFFVGNTKAAARLFAKERERLGTDEFSIKFYNGNIYIFDKADVFSSAGVIYAVCEFLEKFLGVRFYSYDEEYIPKKTEIYIEGKDVYEKPDFLMRQHLTRATRFYPDYAVKMRIKDCFCPDTPGGALYPLWAQGKMWHNLYELIPPEKYKESHPEWFDDESGQLCFTDENLTDEIAEVLKERIEQNPYSKFFALSQNDTDKPCQCANCRKSYEKYTVTGTLIRFVNRVAKKIKAWLKNTHPERKDVFITTFAYYFSIEPPVKKTETGFVPVHESVVPEDNVYIFFTTIDNCFFHRHDDIACEWNKSFTDRINGWKSLVGDRFIFWTYSSNFVHYLYPFFNFHTMAHNFRLLKNTGGRYILDQASCESEFVNFSELRTYVSGKLLWNTDADENLLINDFLNAYYKQAAPYVREYMELFKGRLDYLAEKRGYHLRVFALPKSMFDHKNFPLGFLKKLEKVFVKAFKVLDAAGAPRDGKVCLRLRRVYLYMRYMYVINYDKYFPGSEKRDKERFIDNFVEECRACGITRYKESLQDNMGEFRRKALDGELLKY